MPGLLRGVARTAAIAGTATAVSRRVQRLGDLKAQGILTEAEFEVQKAKLLAS